MSTRGIQSHYYPSTVQTVTVSGTSAATSNAVGDFIQVIRVVSTTDCHLVFGASPTATTSDSFLPANVVEYFTVKPGQKVAFIQNTAGGTAFVTEMTQ